MSSSIPSVLKIRRNVSKDFISPASTFCTYLFLSGRLEEIRMILPEFHEKVFRISSCPFVEIPNKFSIQRTSICRLIPFIIIHMDNKSDMFTPKSPLKQIAQQCSTDSLIIITETLGLLPEFFRVILNKCLFHRICDSIIKIPVALFVEFFKCHIHFIY